MLGAKLQPVSSAMTGRWALSSACCILLIAVSGVNHASAAKPSVTKNCVRLVGDTGSKGRVEITTKDPRFPAGTDGRVKATWLPICREGFTENNAHDLCELLGFKYGRSYYTQEVAFPSKQNYTRAAAMLTCNPKARPTAGHRRELRGGSGGAAAAAVTDGTAGAAAALVAASSAAAVTERRSLSYMQYAASTPRNAPYDCTFLRGGQCGPSGAYAGVECSNEPLPPAPSPPPAPPSPPPYEQSIRVIGGGSGPGQGGLEPNLCPPSAPEGSCWSFGRIELLVDAPAGGGGGQVWAPLCAANEELRVLISRIGCQQAFGWPSLQNLSPIVVLGRAPGEPPYALDVPTGEVTAAGDFNPAAYAGWATLTDLKDVEPSMLQDGNLTVSATPCDSLFRVQCVVLYARR